MAKFYVVKEDDCPECGGTGVVQNWMSEYDAWWSEEVGVPAYGYSDIPDEEPCEECNGTGVHRTEIELSTALKELNLL